MIQIERAYREKRAPSQFTRYVFLTLVNRLPSLLLTSHHFPLRRYFPYTIYGYVVQEPSR